VPTYEYACRACGHVFEIVQKMSDDPLVICPECGGDLRKVFAPPAISFKGSGFYATDHGKTSKAGATPDAPKKEGGESKDAGSTTAKKDGASSSGSSGSKKEGGSS
jgi:putative FmdB family regulatory protein